MTPRTLAEAARSINAFLNAARAVCRSTRTEHADTSGAETEILSSWLWAINHLQDRLAYDVDRCGGISDDITTTEHAEKTER